MKLERCRPYFRRNCCRSCRIAAFSRLGSRASVKVDVRVIAATNIDIKASIAQKAFREDLYYRLNGFTVKMPPLRERTEEIPILSQHFMRKVSIKYECAPLPISAALLQALSGHSWPGNLRELENTIKRYLVLGDEKAIIEELSPRHGAGSLSATGEDTDGSGGGEYLVRNLKGSAEYACDLLKRWKAPAGTIESSCKRFADQLQGPFCIKSSSTISVRQKSSSRSLSQRKSA